MAGSPGGKSVGRVSIRVVPDTSTTKDELKVALDRIEKQVRLEVQLKVDTRQATKDLLKWRNGESGKDVELDADVNTKGASSHLQLFTRLKRKAITLSVDVSKKSLAKVSSTLSGLSGLTSVKNLGTKILSGFEQLPQALPKIAAVTTSIAAVGAVGLHSVAGVASFIGALKPLGPGLVAGAVALPGILAGAGIGLATMLIAFKQAPAPILALKSQWTGLEKTIGKNFWADAQKPILAFVKTTLPSVKTGLAGVASALGGFTGSFATELSKAFSGGVLDGMFSNLAASIKIATGAAAPFAGIIANLGVFGSSLLPSISTWVAKIATQFNAWLAAGIADGSLNTALAAMGGLLSQIWGIAKSVGSILFGVFSAADTAGSTGLQTLASVLATVAGIVNSPQFQTALATLFTGAANGAHGLLMALGPIGDLIGGLAPVLSTFLAGAGQILGTLLGELANSLNNPVFQTGLGDFFDGLLRGIQAIAPALPAVAAALAAVGAFAGALAPILGSVLATALQVIAPLVQTLLGALQPLLPVLGTLLPAILGPIGDLFAGLGPVLKTLSPIFGILGTALGSLIGAADPLIEAIMPGLNDLFSILVPLVGQVLAAFMPLINLVLAVLAPLIQPIIGLLGVLVSGALQPLLETFQILNPVIEALSPILTILAQAIGAVVQTVVDLFTGNFADIGAVWSGVWDSITGYWNGTIAPILGAIGQWFHDHVIGPITLEWQLLQLGWSLMLGAISSAWTNVWNGVQSVVKNVWNGVVGFIQNGVNSVIGLINGIVKGINSLGGAVGIHLNLIPQVSLPRLATGADVLARPGGTAVVAGEAGQDESVVNRGLVNRQLALTADLARQALQSGGRTLEVHQEINLINSVAKDPMQSTRDAAGLMAANLALGFGGL